MSRLTDDLQTALDAHDPDASPVPRWVLERAHADAAAQDARLERLLDAVEAAEGEPGDTITFQVVR